MKIVSDDYRSQSRMGRVVAMVLDYMITLLYYLLPSPSPFTTSTRIKNTKTSNFFAGFRVGLFL